MRILHVLNTNRISGAENVAADICMMFRKEHEMAYCSPDGPIRKSLADREVPFIPLKKMSLGELSRVIGQYKPDIIHCHDVRATVLVSIVSRNIPFISHLHVNSQDMNHLTIKSLLYLIAVQRAKHVIFVSESCLEQFRFSRLISKKTTILRNVIHKGRIERLLELDKNDYGLDFVFMGRIVHQKNPVRVAKVASSILKRCESSRFGVIGGGELSKEMEQIFEQEGVSDRVVFTGRLEYPYKALKDARCLLLCSFFEGTPIAALEALSLGVPVVSTPVDGLKSIIRDHENGYLSEDDEELSNFIQQILTNDDAFNELRKRTLHNFFSINDEYSYAHKLNDIYLLCFGL